MGRWILAIRIGFTYIGTVVGAGFASGQEIYQFFSLFGSSSTWGILLSVILFSWLGTRMMLLGARLNATSYQEFNTYLFGERFGKWMNGFVAVILFGVITAMLSGTGALAQEQLGISFHFGVIITLILAFLVMNKGMEGILSINSLVVPLMLFFTVIVMWSCLHQGDILHLLSLPSGQKAGDWILSAITYVAFNLAMSQAVLIPIGGEIKDEKTLRLGGWLGGIGLGFMLVVSNFAMQLRLEEVKQFEIPMAVVIGALGLALKFFFLTVMWGEIFTTLIGNVYGLAIHLQQTWSLRLHTWIILIFSLGYLCSLVGFPTLISYLYPLFGYCGMLVIVLLMVRRLPQS